MAENINISSYRNRRARFNTMNRNVSAPSASSVPSPSFLLSGTDLFSIEESCPPAPSAHTSLRTHPIAAIDESTPANEHPPLAIDKSPFCHSAPRQDVFGMPNVRQVRETLVSGLDMLAAVASLHHLSEVSSENARSNVNSRSSAVPIAIRPNSSTQHLAGHMTLRMTGGADQPKRSFKCDRCPSRFTQKHHLKRHVLSVHDKARPHECMYQSCNFRFSTENSLCKHMNTVHEKSKPFKCSYPGCNSRFVRRSSVYRHNRRHIDPRKAGSSRTN